MPKSKFHEPESNKAWSTYGKFHVYILDTGRGHYIGHTSNLKRRLKEHASNKVYSTRFSSPRLLWKSGIFKSRESAAKYEAALKSWRDSRSFDYTSHTGLLPMPYYNNSNKPFIQKKSQRGKFTGRTTASRSNRRYRRRRKIF